MMIGAIHSNSVVGLPPPSHPPCRRGAAIDLDAESRPTANRPMSSHATTSISVPPMDSVRAVPNIRDGSDSTRIPATGF